MKTNPVLRVNTASEAVTVLLWFCLLVNGAVGGDDTRPYAARHRCVLDAKKPIALAENGMALADIVLPERCSKVVDFAAKELKSYLDKATGADFKVLRSTSVRSHPQPARTRAALLLGEGPWTEGMTGIKFAALPRDSFVIKEVNGAVIIAGHDDPYYDPEKELGAPGGEWHLYEHATLFGVYDFLERFVGVRFYFPVEELIVVPKTPTLKIPAMDIEEAPDFTVRCAQWDTQGQLTAFADQKQWKAEELAQARSMQTLQSRGETLNALNCHGLQELGLLERFATAHPEYFALAINGKRLADMAAELGNHPAHLCYSSKGLEDEILKDAVSYLSAESATVRNIRYVNKWENVCRWGDRVYPGYFNVMPSDGMQRCYCDSCRPYTESDRVSDLYFGFVARLAQRLKDGQIKGILTTMPYADYDAVPKCDLPDNVKVRLAIRGPWNEQNLTAEERKAPDQLVSAWRKKTGGNKIALWNYMISEFGMTPKGVPPLSPRAVAAFYQRNAPDLDGALVQFGIWNILHNYLNMYVFAKVAWDTGINVEALLAEHHEKLFGPAAKPMAAFYNLLQETWFNKGLARNENTPLGPVERKRSQYETWERTYTDEVLDELASRLDEAEKLAAGDETILRRLQFVRKNFFASLKDARDDYMKLKREIDDLVMEVPILPADQTVTLDGKLDEPVWQNASHVYMVPLAPGTPTIKTCVRAFCQMGKLFLGFDCEEPKTDDMVLNTQARDGEVFRDSGVEIFIKPSMERIRKNYSHVMINANGVVADEMVYSAGTSDWKWNCAVQVESTIENGMRYVLEAAVPIDDLLGHPAAANETILASFARARFLKNEPLENPLSIYYSWSPYLRFADGGGGFHDIENYGALRFVKGGRKRVIIENGSFEGKAAAVSDGNRLESWSVWWVPRSPGQPEPRIEVDDRTYREGDHSLRIQNETILSPADPDQGIRITVVHTLPEDLLKPDTDYLLTYYIKTEGVKPVCYGWRNMGAFIYISTTDGEHAILQDVVHSGDIPWTKQGVRYRTPKSIGFKDGKEKPHLWLCFWNSKGTVWFDDVRMCNIETR